MMDQKSGDKQFKKAKENITVSIFNWSKDYASAASTFDDAFKIYKACGAWQKAIKTLKELVVCNEKMMDSWAMAKNYEAMIDIYMDKYPVDYEVLHKTITDCFVQYRMAESLDKGLQMVTKVTKYLKGKGKQKEGRQILHEAYKISLQDEKSFKKKQIFGIIVENFIENGLYDDAISMYKENIKMRNGEDCEENVLIIVILYILMGQPKLAEQEMYDVSNYVPTFLTSNEAESAENLIKFYKSGQAKAFEKQTTKAAITTLFPLIIIKKLRSVVVPSAEVFHAAGEGEQEQMKKNVLF